MIRYPLMLGLIALPTFPATASAAEGEHLDLPLWAGLPFGLLLLAIALLPLLAEAFWHRNRNKALVAAAFSIPVVLYLLSVEHGTPALLDALGEYASFIILLASLYTVSGGIVLRGDIQARPLTNTA